jgi:hypothetical protein
MTTLREAAQQALEALESWSGMRSLWCAEDQKALDTLRAALEQPEQEPVAWVHAGHLQGLTLGLYAYVEIYTDESQGRVPLYTHPHRREWQSLTEEEVMQMTRAECVDMRWPSTALNIARAIEAALKERNHG